MSRRLALLVMALGFAAAAAAIAAVTAIGNSTNPSPPAVSDGPQSLSDRTSHGPVDANITDDTKHVFGTDSSTKANAHIPLQLSDGTKIEAGLNVQGLLCFNVTVPDRPEGGACGRSVDPNQVDGVLGQDRGYPPFFAGLIGDNVKAVDVLTDQGNISAVIQHGGFFATLPVSAELRGWVVTLADNSQETYNWPPNPGD